MSRLIKAGVALVALSVGSVAAGAADMMPVPGDSDMSIRAPGGSGMPVKGPRSYYKGPLRSVVSYHNWTGLYAGLNLGYGWGTSTWDIAGVLTPQAKPKGMLAGGTLGYNFQTGSVVLGFEGDFSWSGVKGSVDCIPGVFTCETSNTWLGTARGRLGYAFDRFLPYVTGGVAFGEIKATATGPVTLTTRKTQVGWTAGAGLEYAFVGNWSAKLEYLYVDLGKFETGFIAPLTEQVSFKENIVRAGVNYKFSGPISSRY